MTSIFHTREKYLDLKNLSCAVEPRFNEALNNEALYTTKDIPQPAQNYSKFYET